MNYIVILLLITTTFIKASHGCNDRSKSFKSVAACYQSPSLQKNKIDNSITKNTARSSTNCGSKDSSSTKQRTLPGSANAIERINKPTSRNGDCPRDTSYAQNKPTSNYEAMRKLSNSSGKKNGLESNAIELATECDENEDTKYIKPLFGSSSHEHCNLGGSGIIQTNEIRESNCHHPMICEKALSDMYLVLRYAYAWPHWKTTVTYYGHPDDFTEVEDEILLNLADEVRKMLREKLVIFTHEYNFISELIRKIFGPRPKDVKPNTLQRKPENEHLLSLMHKMDSEDLFESCPEDLEEVVRYRYWWPGSEVEVTYYGTFKPQNDSVAETLMDVAEFTISNAYYKICESEWQYFDEKQK